MGPQEIQSAFASLVRPSWADPGYHVATSDVAQTTKALPGGVIVKVADNNPKRWALLVIAADPSLSVTGISPDSRPDLASIRVASGIRHWLFTVFDLGPLVSREWYAHSIGAETLKVFEITTK